MTVIQGQFEWDSEKNEINIKKHGFSFEEVLDVFDDHFAIEAIDRENSSFEETRYKIICCIYPKRRASKNYKCPSC